MGPNRRARTGLALILTLATLSMAGGLALLLQARAGRLSRLERAELEIERLRVAAAEAVREALWILASDENLQVDHLGEDWALPRETLREDGISTRAVVEDAGRFHNWNNLSVAGRGSRTAEDIWLDVLTVCGDRDPVARIEALVDYMDSDDTGAHESFAYRRLDPPYEPPNRILWAPAELLHVHGFSAELLAPRPREALDDLFGGDLSAVAVVVPAGLDEPIPVNLLTANRHVLLGLAGPQHESVVRELLVLREIDPTSALERLAMARPELAASLVGAASISSRYFRVRARAALGHRHHEVLAWVLRDERGDVQILQWVEAGG